MEHHGEGLLRIGLFSRLTAISVRMLRHYHEHHILEPAVIDPFTGRRFYSPAQLTDAHWIVRLRDAGLPVSEIGPLMAQSGAVMLSPGEGVGGATFLDPEYRESDVDVEVWMQVAAPFTPVAPLECREVPARDVVVATLLGSYDGMAEVTSAIGAYIAGHELQTGAMFNIYRVGPAQNPDPATWVTDVCFPIVGE